MAQPGPALFRGVAKMAAVEYVCKCASTHTQRLDPFEDTARVLSVRFFSPPIVIGTQPSVLTLDIVRRDRVGIGTQPWS